MLRENDGKRSQMEFQRQGRGTVDSSTCVLLLSDRGAGREQWSWRGPPQPGGVQMWDTREVTAGQGSLCETLPVRLTVGSHSACWQGSIHHREAMGEDRTERTPGLAGTRLSGFGLQLARPCAAPCTPSLPHLRTRALPRFLLHVSWRSALPAFSIHAGFWGLITGQPGPTSPACTGALLTSTTSSTSLAVP